VLIKENDGSTFVVVILDGVVKVTGLAENGSEAFLAVRASGELVGEFAAVLHLPEPAGDGAGPSITGAPMVEPGGLIPD
jgi:CRP/FNR family cyclic AMP-dependent transcriptional regulator